jgi:hypothetical protein
MPDTPERRRSWLRPQFSLRLLLLAFTAFAIGFPIWYRWPYEEVAQFPSPISGTAKPIDDKRITTWQRQWGGSRLKHGPERRTIGGQLTSLTTYHNGHKEGPYMDYSINIQFTGHPIVTSTFLLVRSSEPVTAGQFADDQKDGVWTEVINGQKKTTTWHHGKQVQ